MRSTSAGASIGIEPGARSASAGTSSNLYPHRWAIVAAVSVRTSPRVSNELAHPLLLPAATLSLLVLTPLILIATFKASIDCITYPSTVISYLHTMLICMTSQLLHIYIIAGHTLNFITYQLYLLAFAILCLANASDRRNIVGVKRNGEQNKQAEPIERNLKNAGIRKPMPHGKRSHATAIKLWTKANRLMRQTTRTIIRSCGLSCGISHGRGDCYPNT